jgi:hypothetical protein
MSLKYLATTLLLAVPALARTDLVGCTYSDGVYTPGHGSPYATRIWFVPESGEICEFLDCGGGRAPPKTTVPGCPLYSGTATYEPSFLPKSTTAAEPSPTADDDEKDEEDSAPSETTTTTPNVANANATPTSSTTTRFFITTPPESTPLAGETSATTPEPSSTIDSNAAVAAGPALGMVVGVAALGAMLL